MNPRVAQLLALADPLKAELRKGVDGMTDDVARDLAEREMLALELRLNASCMKIAALEYCSKAAPAGGHKQALRGPG